MRHGHECDDRVQEPLIEDRDHVALAPKEIGGAAVEVAAYEALMERVSNVSQHSWHESRRTDVLQGQELTAGAQNAPDFTEKPSRIRDAAERLRTHQGIEACGGEGQGLEVSNLKGNGERE
jgi:hypothetical protein